MSLQHGSSSDHTLHFGKRCDVSKGGGRDAQVRYLRVEPHLYEFVARAVVTRSYETGLVIQQPGVHHVVMCERQRDNSEPDCLRVLECRRPCRSPRR